MIIKIIHSMTEVDAACWNTLRQEQDPFLRHEFLLALEQSESVCADTGWLAHHLLVLDNDELIAAMPLYLKSHSWGEYVFDHQWADAYAQSGMEYYPKWVNAIPFTPCSGQRILMQHNVDNDLITQLCIKTIKNISETNNISSLHCLFPNTHQNNQLKQHMLLREGVQFQWFNKDYKNFDHYLQSFTSRQRKNIKKERKKVREQGIQLERFKGNDISKKQWQVFFDFYRLTYNKHGQSEYLNIDFFMRLAETMPEQILLIFAIKEQTYVGAALSFIGEKTLYGRYWGCLEEYTNLHFETCYYQGLEYCIENQLQRFDSGAQGEHKISRGFEPVSTYSTHWIQNPHFSNLIANFLEQEKDYIHVYKQDCLKQLPFKNLK